MPRKKTARLCTFLQSYVFGSQANDRELMDAAEVLSHVTVHHTIATSRFADAVASTIDYYLLLALTDEVNAGGAAPPSLGRLDHVKVSERLTSKLVFDASSEDLMERYSDPVKVAKRAELSRELKQMLAAQKTLQGGLGN